MSSDTSSYIYNHTVLHNADQAMDNRSFKKNQSGNEQTYFLLTCGTLTWIVFKWLNNLNSVNSISKSFSIYGLLTMKLVHKSLSIQTKLYSISLPSPIRKE